jgi:hypothetical protein
VWPYTLRARVLALRGVGRHIRRLGERAVRSSTSSECGPPPEAAIIPEIFSTGVDLGHTKRWKDEVIGFQTRDYHETHFSPN